MGGLATRREKTQGTLQRFLYTFRFLPLWPGFAKLNKDDIDVKVFTAITFLHTHPGSPSKKVFIVSFFHLARLHAYSVASHQRLHGREEAVI